MSSHLLRAVTASWDIVTESGSRGKRIKRRVHNGSRLWSTEAKWVFLLRCSSVTTPTVGGGRVLHSGDPTDRVLAVVTPWRPRRCRPTRGGTVWMVPQGHALGPESATGGAGESLLSAMEPDARAARQRLMNASPFDPRCGACAQLSRSDQLQAWWTRLDEVGSQPIPVQVEDLDTEAWTARPRPGDKPGRMA